MTSLRIALLLAALALTRAAPSPAPAPAPAPSDDDRPEIIEIIAPAASAQETLNSLNLGEPGSELSERNKRTIGILRQLFPTLTQIVEQKIQNFTSMIFQTFGPLILGSLGGGGSGAAGGGTVTFDDDDEDVETISDEDKPKVSVELPAFEPDADPKSEASSPSSSAPLLASEEPLTNSSSETTTATSLSSTSEASDIDNETEDVTKTIRKRSVAQGSAEENQLLSGAESAQKEVRVQFAEGGGAGKDLETAASEDQETAAQTNSGQLEEISLEDGDTSEENRNKRFLNFGFGGGAGASGAGGSGGGSGNFLFDIIRRPAEAVARAAGTAFRFVAGTDSLNLGVTATHSATRDNTQLVAGSSATEPADEGTDAAVDDGAAGAVKGDGLTEGVPGPITRLFIIANRGIANLIQDLILRLAQTSERIVNFKARLITSII